MYEQSQERGLVAGAHVFFGPFGMLYSTVMGAIVMLVLYVALGIPTLGWALAGLHPIAMIWGAWAAHNANQ